MPAIPRRGMPSSGPYTQGYSSTSYAPPPTSLGQGYATTGYTPLLPVPSWRS
jgi:hypothetical protein